MKRVLIFVTLLMVAASAEFSSIDYKELEKMQRDGVTLIDIRTPQEWRETGIISGAYKMMFFDKNGRVNAPEWMYKLGGIIKDKSQPFIIYCAHANRSKLLGEWLSSKMGFKRVYELKDGIENGWIKYGKKTVDAK